MDMDYRRDQMGMEMDVDDYNFGPAMSIEGWVIMVTGIHEEAKEEDIFEPFAEFGPIKKLHLNLDRQTGFVKGYAIIEYDTYEEAMAAIEQMNGIPILGNKVQVDFAFGNGPLTWKKRMDNKMGNKMPMDDNM